MLNLARHARGRETLHLALGVLFIVLLSPLLTPTGRYIVRAAWEEGRILARRRPIDRVMADPATRPSERAKLALVLEARRFAADSIGLRAKRSFTTFAALPHDTLVLVLSAAYRDQLRAVTWWFPIVGRVPYKGFFDPADAVRAEKELAAQGFDTHLRPSAAFSTLGFFNDPVVSTTLRSDSLELANTVIHELTHNTYYAAGQAPFNESFANFVGHRGAAEFFRARGNDPAAHQVEARWADTKTLGRFWNGVYATLDSAFRANPTSRDARLAARDTIFARTRERLVTEIGPKLSTVPPAALAKVRLDNAALLARRVYNTGLDDFDAVYEREGRNLRRAVASIIALAKSQPHDPFGALRRANPRAS
jgi:predicted aminopeptidase